MDIDGVISILNKEGNLDLDCIMPELTSKDTDKIAEKFSFLLSYIIGPSVLNDIILTKTALKVDENICVLD